MLTVPPANEPEAAEGVERAGAALAVIGVVSVAQAPTNTMPDDWHDLDS